MVKLLLQHGVSPEEKDYHDYAPIHYSVILNWIDTVKTLYDAGADINAATSSGKTALMLAVEFDRIEIVEYLLKQVDLQINSADTDGYTALTIAVEKSGDGGMLCAEMLLKSKADPNLQTTRRKTPLKISCNVVGDGEILGCVIAMAQRPFMPVFTSWVTETDESVGFFLLPELRRSSKLISSSIFLILI
jgi:hypothetical protein